MVIERNKKSSPYHQAMIVGFPRWKTKRRLNAHQSIRIKIWSLRPRSKTPCQKNMYNEPQGNIMLLPYDSKKETKCTTSAITIAIQLHDTIPEKLHVFPDE